MCNNPRNYVIPNRKDFRKLLKKEAKKKKNEIIQKLDKIEHVAVTTDGWTSTKQKYSYLGLTVHFFKNFALKTISLGVKRLQGSHTAENLATTLNDFFCEFNIKDKIISITGDNASNMRATARNLNIRFYGCFAHILNLIVTNSIKNLKIDFDDENSVIDEFSFAHVLKRCRSLVCLFSHSTHLNEKLLEDQEKDGKKSKLRLVQDVKTRLKSFYKLNIKMFFII